MPERVKVQGDLFHGRIPEGSVYVGRQAVGLSGSIYANPFRVGKPIRRDSELWPYVLDIYPDMATPVMAGVGFASVSLLRAEDCVAAYSRWFFDLPYLLLNAAEQLGGRDLCCWCKLPEPGEPDHCHAAWLLELVAGLTEGGSGG